MLQQKKLQETKVIMSPYEDALSEERPRIYFRRAVFYFFVVMVILCVIYLTTPLSRLGIVYFDGLNMLNRSELISLIDIDEDELFLSIRLSDIKESIEKHPIVNQVNVSRAWINRIRVEVIEYEVAVCALVESEMFHILTDGVILHESIGMRANCDEMMIHDLTQDEIESNVATLFVRQLMRVDPEIRDLIQMIEHEPLYGDIYRFFLLMIDGNVVKVTAHTMPEQLNRYLNILEEFLRIGRIELGETGILHLDVGNTFSPHE